MIYEQLYDFQRRIVDKFKDRRSLGLFLDMGLGKTPTALALAEQNNCTKVIIITINAKACETESINGSWLFWAKQSSVNYLFHNKSSKNQSFTQNSHDLLILNYEALFKRGDRAKRVELKDNIVAFLQSCKGHNLAIIVDESHKMKNLQSIQTTAIMQIKRYGLIYAQNTYTYLLTGTPFTQGYIDLYAQLKMLGSNMTKTAFCDNFCVRGNLPGLLGWQQPIVGYKNLSELYDLIHEYALTVKSEDVVNLPEKIFRFHPVECSHSFTMLTSEYVKGTDIIEEDKHHTNKITNVAIYNTTKKVNNPYFRNIAYPDLRWTADTNGTFWLRARQMSIGFQGNSEDAIWFDKTRLAAIKQFLSDYRDNYLIFYNYTAELFELFDICDELGYKVDIYCGDIKSLVNYEAYSRMTEEQKLTATKRVIIANFASGATGMNWQEYNKGIIFSMPLFKDYEQGLKRLHRLGQKNTVIWHVFYQKNWLDYSMKKALEQQTDYSLKMFEADLSRISELTSK